MMGPFFARIRTGGILLAVAAALGALLFSGCAKTSGPPPGEEADRLDYARGLFEKGEYDRVILALNQLMADRPGSRYVEESTFLIGRAYYEQGAYLDAEDQFRRYRREFPAGDFAPQASYYLGLSLLSQSRNPQLDQTETRAALTQFNSFLTQYPDHELVERSRMHVANIRAKLAEKEYMNGRLYLRRGYHPAARFYFQEKVLAPYGDTPWAAPSMLGLARSYAKTKQWAEAAEWAERLRETFPETEEAEEAQHILKQTSQYVDVEENVTPVSSPPAAAIPPR